ncbi:hypothetical protein Xen7305DRAFT_00028380 [Xenococcus sp. PCC 7305]|uniref:hypothetical protein n=1 Tax=Xenococcus sp. PCC 7305 TaxID=102125 RepID=UPI0002ACBFC1|nr:hypothetical protein [Xenococcus sp. PCC 7305]ELS03118.1 hypothetical protein Xen7305DRAFT_00028380 [Xenococcus sp. PCC 7305]
MHIQLERTSPLRWTVELDNGTFNAVIVSDFAPMSFNSQQCDRKTPEPLEIPFSDDNPYLVISQQEQEIIALINPRELVPRQHPTKRIRYVREKQFVS